MFNRVVNVHTRAVRAGNFLKGARTEYNRRDAQSDREE